MKRISVFALPSHQIKQRTSGVDFARVIQPMKHLDGYEGNGYKFKVDVYDIFNQEKFNWINVAENYDVVFLNYTILDWSYAAMGAIVHGKGKKIIMDVDDAIWNINPDNPTHQTYKDRHGGEILSAILDDVDGITTTNLYLKHLIASHLSRKRYDKMAVFPNQIDLKYWDYKAKATDRNPITLYHMGSTTHFRDLSNLNFIEGVNRIFRDYPNVIFKTVGAYLGRLKMKWGQRYVVEYGDPDIFKWITKFKGMVGGVDIAVVPLEDNIYNRCKSDIKFLEMSSATIPGVWQRIRQYEETIKPGITGYLASTPEEWYDSIKILLDSVEKRREIGENAYNYVAENRTMQKLVPEYAKFIIKILTT